MCTTAKPTATDAASRSEDHERDRVCISVLVPVLNEACHIRETVARMRAQRFDGTIELLFADGRSKDRTREILAEIAAADSRVRVLDNPRRGTASGLNVCLSAARGEYVARMDAHTFYPEDYLALGVDRLGKGDVGWVAGPQVPVGVGPVGRAVAAALEGWLGRGGSAKWDGTDAGDGAGEHDLDTGVFCGVWRRDELLEIGGFDEEWPRNQDSELAARFLRQGRRIVCVPAMGARYHPRESLPGLWRQYRGYGVYRAKTARRHPTSLRRSAVLPPLLVVDAVTALFSPRPTRQGARIVLAAYAATLLAASGRSLAASERSRLRSRDAEALLLSAVLATMHIAHGVGFLEGVARWGVPSAALLRVAGLRRDPVDEAPFRGLVSAPNLRG